MGKSYKDRPDKYKKFIKKTKSKHSKLKPVSDNTETFNEPVVEQEQN